MSAFLQRKPLPEARALLLAGVAAVGDEEIAVSDAAGRITAQNVVAAHPAPHYRASAMDGIAVRAADTRGAADGPLVLRMLASAAAEPSVEPCCLAVDTGSLLPDWANAVIRIEDTVATGDGFRIAAVVPPGRDVRRAGEDIEAATLLLPAGAPIRAWDIGAMLATGVTTVRVRRRPRIAILATGSEVVEPESGAAPGQVIDSNSRVIAALLEGWGAAAHRLGILADDEDGLRDAVADAAARFDAVCVIAGSAAGRKDFTISTLATLGEVFVHGVDIAPGRPVALARIPRVLRDSGEAMADGAGSTPVLAVPGYPVAAIVACEQLLRPLVAALLGSAEEAPLLLCARLARKIPSRLGVEEFRRVCVTRQADGSRIVAPLPSGAGSISTVTGAHGWLRIEATVEGLDAGSDVDVELIVAPADVDAAFVLAGSPTEASGSLEQLLRHRDPRARVLHLRLGKGDAVRAVESGEAHATLITEAEAASPLVLRALPGTSVSLAVVAGSAGDRMLDAATP